VTTANRATFVTTSVAQTRSLGRRIARFLRAGDVVFLQGPLGAGKTAFAQGVGQGLKVETTVNSPTFVLLTRHEGPLRLYHADLYRLTDPAEVDDLALDQQAADGVLLIEWPERGIEVLPPERLLVILEPSPTDPNTRRITIVANGERYARILDGLGARG
jgi:tRNA threonylcarbamoyladenosine biosynthesis protein TsaE